jgi:H+/Cl- antiporter ClcA
VAVLKKLKKPGLAARFAAVPVALMLGMATGLAALGLFSTVRFFNDLWRLPLPSVLGLDDLSFSPAVGVALLIAALVSGQILRLLENGRPHGPADLILGAQKNHCPNIKAGMLSSLLATVNLSGGASVGVFGPLIHFGGCLSALLARGFRPFTRAIPLDVVLGSGAAAAIAAVFSAPIGAAIMAHEAIIRRFGGLGAGPVIAAAFGAHWAAQNILGDHRMFSIESSPAITVETFVTAIGLGITTGILSVHPCRHRSPRMGSIKQDSPRMAPPHSRRLSFSRLSCLSSSARHWPGIRRSGPGRKDKPPTARLPRRPEDSCHEPLPGLWHVWRGLRTRAICRGAHRCSL